MGEWNFEQTELFEKNFSKLIPSNIQEAFKKQIRKLLSENPYAGKPLGYKFFREKRIKKWRIYYLIYENNLVLFFINISDKKLQQSTIDKIKSDLSLLKEYINQKYETK